MQSDQCSICLDEPKLPIKLICKHIFCYLCIKSVKLSHYDAKCPNCREPISDEILQQIYYDPREGKIGDNCEYQWLYSAKKKGWWKFDPEHNTELEELYQEYLRGKKKIETEMIVSKYKTKNMQNSDNIDISESESESSCECEFCNNCDYDDNNFFTLNIGYLKFKIDFDNMQQINPENEFRRSIKRIKKNELQHEANILGIAGLTIKK